MYLIPELDFLSGVTTSKGKYKEIYKYVYINIY